ncbi:MAG: hypothetical protein VW378_07005 [bacterium]
MSIFNHWDPQEMQRRLKNVEFGNRFPMILDVYQDRLITSQGPLPDSDQRSSFIYWMGSSLNNISQQIPFEELRHAELMDGARSGKKLNFENVDSLSYDFYRNYFEYKDLVDAEFEAGMAAGKDPDVLVKELYARFALPSSKKPSYEFEYDVISYGSPHDIQLHGPVNERNFSLKGERLHDYLNKDIYQDYYFAQNTNTLDILGQAHYDNVQRSLDLIVKQDVQMTDVPDIYLDNKSQTVPIYENMHQVLLDREFQDWDAEQFYSYLHRHRSNIKNLEKTTRHLFGSVSEISQIDGALRDSSHDLNAEQVLIHSKRLANLLDDIDTQRLTEKEISMALYQIDGAPDDSTLGDLYYLYNQADKTEEAEALLVTISQRVETLKTRYRPLEPPSDSFLYEGPIAQVTAFFDTVDWQTVNPLDFQPLQMVFHNQQWLRRQYFDQSINPYTDAGVLLDFKEQGLAKALMHYNKVVVSPLQGSFKVVTSHLHKDASDIVVGAHIFSKLIERGILSNDGTVQPSNLPDLSRPIFPDQNDDLLVKNALLEAVYGSKEVNFDLLDSSSKQNQRYDIQIESAYGDSFHFLDILSLPQKGDTFDEKRDNLHKAYSILMDMFKSMTGFDTQHDTYTGAPHIQESEQGFYMDVSPLASWMEYDENSKLYVKKEHEPLRIYSENSEDLVAFHTQVRRQLAHLEPLVTAFMTEDSKVLSHQGLKIVEHPIEVLVDNQGLWDPATKRIIKPSSDMYRVTVDYVATPRYFETETMQTATDQFREDLEEFIFIKHFENLIYSSLSKDEHDQQMKEEKEKKELVKKEYIAEVKQKNKESAQAYYKQVAENRKKRNKDKKDQQQAQLQEISKKNKEANRAKKQEIKQLMMRSRGKKK